MNESARLAELEKRLKGITAADMMTRSVITAREEMRLVELAELIIKNRISGVPVVNDSGDLVGIITATDMFQLIYMIRSGEIMEGGAKPVCNPTVGLTMSSDVFTLRETVTLDEIIKVTQERNIHTLPVTRDGKLVGIIGRRDVFKRFYSLLQEISTI
ncbi:MAG: CBS domain-containing protein [Candidatus Omnitrophota bacterium]